jgi:ComF family protein
VPQLVGALKFHGRLSCARLLGQYLAGALDEIGAERPELVLPIPLHRARLRERGYNQAVEIAREVGQALNLTVDSASCGRKLATPPQTGLEQRERRKNLRGAFDLCQPIRAHHVAILDDVVTTGSTVTELARLLKRAGIQRVDVWAVARTP